MDFKKIYTSEPPDSPGKYHILYGNKKTPTKCWRVESPFLLIFLSAQVIAEIATATDRYGSFSYHCKPNFRNFANMFRMVIK